MLDESVSEGDSLSAQASTTRDDGSSPRATFHHGRVISPGASGASDGSPAELGHIELGDTMDAEMLAAVSAAARGPRDTEVAAGRTTVLPRRSSAPAAAADEPERPRFQHIRPLGFGAMGEVGLARDNDIRRTVAIKRVHDGIQTEATLRRFADEVRIVGQLEHPGIVPIYDVGRDDGGRVYLVMKHLRGETMESIIAKLREGDAEYLARYPIGERVRLFLGVLDAIRYAHARGVIHRDLKPANIMVGPYGEITILDWGVAKPIKEPEVVDEGLEVAQTGEGRAVETTFGSLVGTPLYMSPEQAAGHSGEIDERSDVYTLVVVLFEWLTTRHLIDDDKTVQEVLAWVMTHDYSFAEVRDAAMAAGVPMEYVFELCHGLQRDPDKRFQSANELDQALRKILAGQVRVQCHITLAKRSLHSFMQWIDEHPVLYTLGFLLVGLGLLAAVVLGIVHLVG